MSRTPSIPRKSERLVRSSFFILRVEFNLLRGSTGRFSSSLTSTGGGGGFSFGGSTLVGGPRGNANPVTISSSLDRFSGKICRNKRKSLQKWKFIEIITVKDSQLILEREPLEFTYEIFTRIIKNWNESSTDLCILFHHFHYETICSFISDSQTFRKGKTERGEE